MSREKNLIKFIFEQHNRLSCIKRFNNTPRLGEESVSEHSFSVAFLSMLVGNYLEKEGLKFDKPRLMPMALVHDMEEIISGDIIKVIKSGGFKKELDKLNTASMEFLTNVLGEEGEIYLDLWKEAKEKNTIEAKIIDLLDMVACILYCVKEIHLGNKYFREVLEYAVKKVLKFSQKIPEAKRFIREITDYSLGYLLEDKKILDAINRAVRIYDYEEDEDENK